VFAIILIGGFLGYKAFEIQKKNQVKAQRKE